MSNRHKQSFNNNRDQRDHRDNHYNNGYRNNRNNKKRDNSNYIDESQYKYIENQTDLINHDNMYCTQSVITNACNSFDTMNGETGLKEELLRGIYAYGFDKPSRIQEYGIPQLIKGKDILAQSHSGTGKTGTFMVSSLQLINDSLTQPQIIILSPTCELAKQTYNVGIELSKFMKTKISLTVGGTPIGENITELKKSQLVVATIGRLLDMMKKNINLFKNIKTLIIDECDEMLSDTFGDDIKDLLSLLSENTQICLFSATLKKDIIDISECILRNPEKILIEKEKTTLDGIKQRYVSVGNVSDKFNIIIDMLDTVALQKFIVYINSSNDVTKLHNILEENGFKVLSIFGKMSKVERSRIVKEFRSGDYKCLISTDLLSRGIDIEKISLVINFDLPSVDKIENYIHRIGRTGRYGKSGYSINLVDDNEKRIQDRIATTYNCKIEPLKEDYYNEI